jgi:thymidylate synthase
MAYQCRGIGLNDAFHQAMRGLLDFGEPVVIDGGKNDRRDCIEIENFICTIANAKNRTLICPFRGNNPFATLYETVWVLAGESSVEQLKFFLPRCVDFVDKHIQPNHWRAAYGKRLRKTAGFNDSVGFVIDHETRASTVNVTLVDQIKFVYQKLKEDPSSRQAVMTIWDPAKECTVEKTNDYPCSNHVTFLIRHGLLNCTLNMRSNDVLWGFSAINVYEFTVIQEILAKLLGVEVGKYTHHATSFHYYKDFESRIRKLADQPLTKFSPPHFEFPVVEGDYDATMVMYENIIAKIKNIIMAPVYRIVENSGNWLENIMASTEIEKLLSLFVLNEKREELGATISTEFYAKIMRSIKDTDLKYSCHFWMNKNWGVFDPDELQQSNDNMDSLYAYKEK